MKERRDRRTRDELRSLLCASTCHFTAEDNETLKELAILEQEDRGAAEVSDKYVEVFNISYGYLLICRFEEPGGIEADHLEEVKNMHISDALIKLIDYARSKGYHGLWFDNVFDTLEHFETFEW